MTPYEYKSLDLSKDAIRLLRLHKGRFGDDIKCELIETLLQETEGVPYEALSYTWSSGIQGSEITLDGKPAKTTANLYAALRYLRLQDLDRLLWVDALCINQDDHRERAHQVGQMRLIYEKAERVVVWLGESSADIELLLEAVKRQLDDEGLLHEDQGPLSRWRKEWLQQAWVQKIQNDDNKVLRQRYLAALDDLLARPWFRRVWVIQEVASAKTAIAVCGYQSISTRTFALIPPMMGVQPPAHTQAVLDVMPGPSRKLSWWAEKRDLQTLLAKFGRSEASDPRDRLYALVGMSTDARGIVRADYDKEFERVVRDTIAFLIFHRFLDGYQLPSWDWDDLISFLESGDLASKVFDWAMDHDGVDLLNLFFSQNIYESSYYNETQLRCLGPLLVETEQGAHEDTRHKTTAGAILVKAAGFGHTTIVSQLLRGPDLEANFSKSYRTTALGMAIRCRDGMVFDMLLASGVDVNQHCMVSRELKQDLEQDLEQGLEQDLEQHLDRHLDRHLEGGTPLWIAAKFGCEEMARKLLGKGALESLETSDPQHHRTPLWVAVERGHTNMARLLLENGASMHSRNEDTESLIEMAEWADKKEQNRTPWLRRGEMTKLILAALHQANQTRSD